MTENKEVGGLASAFQSTTFGQDVSFDLDKPVGSASISPCGRDVVLASRQGLHIIDLDSPYSPPRHLPHHTPWEVADVQWSPFAARDYWVVSTSNQKALVWNLLAKSKSSVEHVLHAHTRAITDINFSAHNPDILATCAIDSFVHCWDLRHPSKPAMTFCDWFAAATQVKWNRQDSHILVSSHDRVLRIWDDRKGAYPLRSIEAHATKIYGIDWSRTETSCLVTCSLDRTIKFWDYTKDLDEPNRVLHTPFPVWRARHTPFGFGLLAMPQRSDHDLHLYDCRTGEDQEQDQTASAVSTFGGHHDPVKEFLWRPRGTVTESVDDREFQLVSWGTDRMLRLHQVNDDVLDRVGYKKGMKTKRAMNFTRRNATYRTFREISYPGSEDDRKDALDSRDPRDGLPSLGIRSALTSGMSKAPAPFIGGFGSGGFMSPIVGRKSAVTKDMDPIVWMKGVRIGKRERSPSGLHSSVSSILSPSHKTDPTWDRFDSLGEEISHIGDKFTKVSFEEVDMQRRSIVVSLTGPWGFDKTTTFIKARIEFPPSYPEGVAPSVSLERCAVLDEHVVTKIGSETSVISASFLSCRRSSLEAILRYLLGEQTLEESLLWLKKRQQSVDLDSTIEADFSSSDEDDETLEQYAGPQADDTGGSDSLIIKSRPQNNPPLPQACGAFWADNGRLVCFFPPKQDKEHSFLDLSLKSGERTSKSQKFISEGFGRFHNSSHRKRQAASTLETIESGGSDSESSSSASSSSNSFSASDDIGLPRHHFMPSMAWRGDASETFPGLSLDESQKSSSGVERSRSTFSKGKNFVSIHDHSDLLPARKALAQQYLIGSGSHGFLHNAEIAREMGDGDLADVWLFVDLLLQDKVPLEVMNHSRGYGNAQTVDPPALDPVLVVARRALSKLRSKDSAIDLSFDEIEDETSIAARASVKWGDHPYARRFLVDALFRHYEQKADVQMLAMLSCAFSEHRGTLTTHVRPSGDDAHKPGPGFPRHLNSMRCYYPSESVARDHLSDVSPKLPSQAERPNDTSGQHSAHSSTGAPLSDLSASTTPPSNYRPLRAMVERRESLVTSLSTSPEQMRQSYRSSPNLTALGASMTRPSTIIPSTTSSPPKSLPRKRFSPAGNYLGVSTSTTTWSPSQLFGRSSSTITEGLKSSFSRSASDADDDALLAVKKPVFTTTLRNQDRFQYEGYSDAAFLDPGQRWRYRAYRDAYAHLLYIWGLPIARTELAKYNGAPTSDPGFSNIRSASLLVIGKRGSMSPYSRPEIQCLDFRDHCKNCNAILPEKPLEHRCNNCSIMQRPVICILCNTFIQGLSSPCLNCGHVLHSSCRELLHPQSLGDVPSECISGCGCSCADYTSIDLKSAEQAAHTVHAELSPTVTVSGDAVANEQEQLGWYNQSEWEDMAYESLTRNLGSRQAVKPKKSQIWRAKRDGT